MKSSRFIVLALPVLLVACEQANYRSGYVPPVRQPEPSIVEKTVDKVTRGRGDVYTVRTISSHYPQGNSNSETTIIVYESGDSGHTKEFLCMFPPDFQLDGNLSTRKLDEMKIPPHIRRAREVFDGCGDDYSCMYGIMARENPKVADATVWLKGFMEDENNTDLLSMYYRNQALFGKERKVLEKGVMQLVYKDFDDVFYTGETVPVPELTGIRHVRVIRPDKEYATGRIGYLCEKVD